MYDRSKWTRKRTNHRLMILTHLPLHNARLTDDPWTYENGRATFVSNPVWEAACVESARLDDLYQRKVPLAKWGIVVPAPDDDFWGPFGDPGARRRRQARWDAVRAMLDSPDNNTLSPDSFSLQAGQDELDSWANFVRELRSKKV